MNPIKINKLLDYINRYDTNYGKVQVVSCGEYIFVRFYNGGWSENEYIDRLVRRSYRNNMILDDHPVMILKLYAHEYFTENFNSLLEIAEVKDVFQYTISYGEI